MKKCSVILVILLYGLLDIINGQLINFGCPRGWILHNNRCYLFADDEHRVYEEADAFCWSTGAKLVAVESYTEHKFITDYLNANDILRRDYWYTSGKWFNNQLYWDSTHQFHASAMYWTGSPWYNYNQPYDLTFSVAYAFGGVEDNMRYGWMNVSTSTLGFAICDILKTDADKIEILERDFDYGHGATDPTAILKGPFIQIQPDNIVMIHGAANVEFDCFATGNPLPNYQWYYGLNFTTSTELTSSKRRTLSGNVLTVGSPVESDVGSYHCRASNTMGTVLSDKAKMIMGTLGSFANIRPEPVYASVFKGTKMDCQTPAYSPGVTYQWFKNAATNIFVWPDNPNIFVSHSGSLYFSEVQPTDANKYYFCVVSLVATEGFKLAKAYAPARTGLGQLLILSNDGTSDNDYGPIINTHAFPTPALQGQTIRLECVAYGTHPLFYSWSRAEGVDFVEGTEITAMGRVLTIKNAPVSAEGDYICTCIRGSGARAYKTIAVFIEAKPYFPYPIRNMLVDPGIDIKWYCKAVSRPSAIYTWYKNGEQIYNIPGKRIINSNIMEIRNVDEDQDEGMYQCAATNSHGTTFSTGQLKILNFAPNFKRFPLPDVTMAAAGSNLTIPCGVEAAPKPDVAWLKNGGDLGLYPGDVGGRRSMDIRYGLVLSPVEYADQGVYTCRASNSHGEASETTTLIVAQGIRIVRPPTGQTVQVNRTAFFYCEASRNTEYDLTYVWKFNGRPIDYKLSPEFVTGRRQGVDGLYVTNTQYKHHGMFECEARTTMGFQSAIAMLSVVGPPGPPAGVYTDKNSVTPRSVRLIWTVTQAIHHGGPITAYDIEAESHYKPGVWVNVAADVPEYFVNTEAVNMGRRPDQRSFLVDTLIPNTSYKFRVRAINMYGRGQEASLPSSSVKISATEPVIAPRNVGGGNGTVGTLTIIWEPLDISEFCGPNLAYWVFWRLKGDTKDWKRNLANDAKAMDLGMFVETVGEKNYYLEYDVKVGAFNSIGDGPNSSVVTIFSAMGMPPGVPITLDTYAINGTAIVVNWLPVADDRENMRGRVAGYRIHYYENPTGEYSPFVMDTEPDPNVVGMMTKNVYGQQASAMIIGLTPNCEQFVRVQVFNTAGYGPKGEWRRAETYNNPVSNYPTHIAVYPHDEHSALIRWRGIGTLPDEESLQGYIIRVWKVQQDVRTATDYKTEKVMEFVIGGLQKHTVYVVRVLGYSTAGDGAISEAVYFTVLGGSIPFDPTTTEICYSDADTRMCDGGEQLYLNAILLAAMVLMVRLSRL